MIHVLMPSSVLSQRLYLRTIVEDHRLCHCRSRSQSSPQIDLVYHSLGFLIDDLYLGHLDLGLYHFFDIRRLDCVIVLENKIVDYDEDFENASVSEEIWIGLSAA